MPSFSGLVPPTDIVILGKIVGPHGLRGAVKVHPFADDPEAWSALRHWWVGQEGMAPELWREARLLRCKVQGGVLVAELDCFADRDASESARGLFVGVPRSELPRPDEDQFYWADLIGLEVFNTREESLGLVLGLIETSANDVLRVGTAGEKERLLPFVASVVLDVDLEKRVIRVDWGLDW